MKTSIFTIYDDVSKKAGNLFFADTIGEAERQFKDALIHAPEGSLFHTHPQDYRLVKVGEFDSKKPRITCMKHADILTGDFGTGDINIEHADLKNAESADIVGLSG